jgi:thiol:disulfide interchange protein DsbC
MKKIVLLVLMSMLMVNTGFALERPWEKGKGTETKKERSSSPEPSESERFLSTIPLDNALVMGNRNARLKVIVFTEPDCSFCARLHKEMKTVVQKRNDIVFFLKLYPLASHNEAYWKSKSIVCNNSVELLEDIFNKKTISKNDCGTREIDDNIELAKALGITGVPTMIFANGKKVIGGGAIGESDSIIRLIEENKAD